MSQLPEILIQIHYHLRPGGVRTVMSRYAETFLKCKSDQTAESYIICSSCGADISDLPASVIDVPECDYKMITEEARFSPLCDHLLGQIENAFSVIAGRTAVIIAHNLTLAKNPALSAAFYMLAMKWSTVRVRFFSVIHDFAEEGRADLMEQITSLENQGVNIRESLYCIGAPVHIVVPGVTQNNILKRIGLPVTLLQNPVSSLNKENCVNNCGEYKNKLKKYAQSRGIELDLSKKIFYYPVRVITRKNILEAIVISCLLCNGILLTGSFGKSKVDERRLAIFSAFIKRHKLPVLFDSFEAFSYENKSINPMVKLMCICDFAISSSIAEGFGYGLYEPWLYEKAVIARKPSGFVASEIHDVSFYYSWFPIPQEWISIDRLSDRYREQYYSCYKSKLPWIVDKEVCRNSTVDFGALDEEMQFEIVESVLHDKSKMIKWKKLLENKSSVWPGIKNLLQGAQENIHYQKELISHQLSYERFQSEFESCFSQIPSIISQKIDPDHIQIIFQSPKFFRLLLNPV